MFDNITNHWENQRLRQIEAQMLEEIKQSKKCQKNSLMPTMPLFCNTYGMNLQVETKTTTNILTLIITIFSVILSVLTTARYLCHHLL